MSIHLLFIKKKCLTSLKKAILREKDSSSKDGPRAGVPFVPSRKKPVMWNGWHMMACKSPFFLRVFLKVDIQPKHRKFPSLIWPQKNAFCIGDILWYVLHLPACHDSAHSSQAPANCGWIQLPLLSSRMCDRKNRTSTTYLPYLIAFETPEIAVWRF